MSKSHAKSDLDWDAFRFFVAAAEEGSLSAAARRLQVTQPTVARRLRELETKLGVKLFEREIHGYVLTAVGRSILDLSRDILGKTIDIERFVENLNHPVRGRVRIATADGLGVYWLSRRLEVLRDRIPTIDLQVLTGPSLADLSRREADLALRVGEPGCEDLVGRKIATATAGVYASRPYLEKHGEPMTVEDLKQHVIIESVGAIAEMSQACRLRELAGDAAVGLRCNNLVMQIEIARRGLGLVALPDYIASTLPEFRRVLVKDFGVPLDIWLLTRRDLLSTTPVRSVFDFLVREMGGRHNGAACRHQALSDCTAENDL